MENSTLQDDQFDSSGHLIFEPANLKTRSRPQAQEDTPSPPQKGPSREHGAYGRPITLKPGLHTEGVDRPVARPRPAPPGAGADLISRKARPIGLKPGLDDHARDVPLTRKTRARAAQGARPEPRRAKASRVSARKPQAKRSHQHAKASAPRPKRQAAVGAARRPQAAVAPKARPVTSVPDPKHLLEVLEAWRAWAGMHRRLLWTIGLSFGAGLLVHSWFAADPLPMARQVVESRRPTQLPLTKVATPTRRPTPSPRYAPRVYGQSTPRRDDYAPLDGFYLDPTQRGTRPPLSPTSQFGNTTRQWRGYGQQSAPQQPAATPWRQSMNQGVPSYWDGMRRPDNPWNREEWAY